MVITTFLTLSKANVCSAFPPVGRESDKEPWGIVLGDSLPSGERLSEEVSDGIDNGTAAEG